MPTPAATLSAREAAESLSVSRSTLYAYVSRGLIRSESVAGSRRKRYRRSDVDALRQRQRARRDPEQAAGAALDWGMPVAETAITSIIDGQFRYRGADAIELARSESLEQVASRIWLDAGPDQLPASVSSAPVVPPALRQAVAGLAPIARVQAALPLMWASEPAAFNREPHAVAVTGLRMLRSMVAAATGGQPTDTPIAEQLANAWAPGHTRVLDTALVLCADHELNPSSFTARVVASTSATLPDVVLAGLAALKGPRHGGVCDRVEAVFTEVRHAPSPADALMARLRRGDSFDGFGHRLYPDGDPRGRCLLEAIQPFDPPAMIGDVIRIGRDAMGAEPSIDFALVAMALTLALPPGAAIAVFAIGRAVGWIGHAIEAWATGQLIRPRARYVGRDPRQMAPASGDNSRN